VNEDRSNKNRGKQEEELGLALERLVREKLGLSEGAALLGNKLYKKPTSEEAELHLRDRVIPHVNVGLTLERSDLELGESFHYEIELQNIAKEPVFLSRIEEVVPAGFEVASHSDTCTFANNLLNLHGRKLDPYSTEEFGVTLRAIRKGAFILAPKVWFMAETGRETPCKPEPASVNVSQTILPGRVTTGFQDLDNLLLGGIPQGFDIVLTSASCDERDLLIRRFLEAGLRNNEVTFYVTMSAAGILKLAEEFPENFTIFVCNQKLDEALKALPNVFKMGGVENLTELNISLESAFRKLPKPNGRNRRACVDILSDVLLQHRAVQSRKWLAGLVPEFRSRGFTNLAIMNPHMHPSEENHAVRSLFQGEISIYEKETKGDQTKYMRIMRMYNQRYLESEMPLRKARLMTASGKLPCCTRMPNL
jgi:KaiC/GvpD/RAD55 family RecA-like ATPase